MEIEDTGTVAGGSGVPVPVAGGSCGVPMERSGDSQSQEEMEESEQQQEEEPEDSSAASDNPWPYIKEFIEFSKRDGKKLVCMCKLCPGKPELSAHTSSMNNLKVHVHKKHKARCQEFEELLKRKSRRGQQVKKDFHLELLQVLLMLLPALTSHLQNARPAFHNGRLVWLLLVVGDKSGKRHLMTK